MEDESTAAPSHRQVRFVKRSLARIALTSNPPAPLLIPWVAASSCLTKSTTGDLRTGTVIDLVRDFSRQRAGVRNSQFSHRAKAMLRLLVNQRSLSNIDGSICLSIFHKLPGAFLFIDTRVAKQHIV